MSPSAASAYGAHNMFKYPMEPPMNVNATLASVGESRFGEVDLNEGNASDSSRRHFLRMTGGAIGAVGAISMMGSNAFAQSSQEQSMTDKSAAPADPRWDKIFPKSNKVDQRKVTYMNRLGIKLVADLYTPKGLDLSRKHPALIVGHPLSSVKEQASGLYAQALAERGFVTLAHDASYNGESGGQPHAICSPEAFVEDFSAGVDYLGTQVFVDRHRIGVIGVCASGGFSLSAAQIDSRIKAVATVTMYDVGGERRDGLLHSMDEKGRKAMLDRVAEQRWKEFAGDPIEPFNVLPEVLPADAHPILREFYEYYLTPLGYHPRQAYISLTSNAPLMQFRPSEHVDWISPRPVLIVAGEHAHSRYFSEEAFANAAEPKEFFLVPGAGHVDLYHRVDLIPWDKLDSFFNHHLIG